MLGSPSLADIPTQVFHDGRAKTADGENGITPFAERI